MSGGPDNEQGATARWRQASRDQRVGEITQALTLIQVEIHNPDAALAFVRSSVSRNPERKMRAVVSLSNVVTQLRSEGKIDPLETLTEKACSMADLEPQVLLQQFSAFKDEVSGRRDSMRTRRTRQRRR